MTRNFERSVTTSVVAALRPHSILALHARAVAMIMSRKCTRNFAGSLGATCAEGRMARPFSQQLWSTKRISVCPDDRRTVSRAERIFSVSPPAMRQILVQHYRRSNTWKRGAGSLHIPVSDDLESSGPQTENLDDLDQALTRLEAEAPELSQIVELRFFGGLTVEETAEFLSVSTPTVKRRWALARAWLHRELRPDRQLPKTV